MINLQALASELKASGCTVVVATETSYVEAWLVLLATCKDFTYRMQTSHWNVRSSNFKEMHELFGEWYNNGFNTEDQAAEQIRMLDINYVIPNTIPELLEHSLLKAIARPDVKTTQPRAMLIELLKCLKQINAHINELNIMAEQNKDVAGIDLLGQLAGTLQKGIWFVRAYISKSEGSDKI